MSISYIVGVDLGQAQDYSAVAALQREPSRASGPSSSSTLSSSTLSYTVVGLHRFPLGTAYTSPDPQRPGVGEQLRTMLRTPPLPGCHLAVDQTGVGRAVVDVLRGLNLPCAMFPITITAGKQASQAEDGWHVPKADLVAVLQVLFQSGRLQIRPELKLAQTLISELDNFRVKITAAANETFGAWREGQNDDLVLAVALAAWLGERCPAFTLASIGMGKRTEVASLPRGVSMNNDFRRWPRGV